MVSETAEKLGEVRSGELSMRVLAAPRGERLERGAGFTIRGPFALAAPSALPVADVDYTQIAGPNRASVGFVSTGREGFLRVAGETYELGAAQERELRSAPGASGEDDGGLEKLEIERWVRDPRLAPGGRVDGVETDRVTSGLDVVAAANGILAVARPGSPAIEGDDARQLERAARSARLELVTGREDRLLRSLKIDLDLAADVPATLRTGLGPLGGARFSLVLEVAEPNRPVRVRAPRGARPAGELPSG